MHRESIAFMGMREQAGCERGLSLVVPSGREFGASGDARLSKDQWRRGSLRK
jgi:hypothetical protein